MALLVGLALYAAAGVAVALAFVTFGVTRRAADAGLRRGAHADLPRRRRALALRARPLAEIRPMRRAHRSIHRALWPILARGGRARPGAGAAAAHAGRRASSYTPRRGGERTP